MRQLQSLMRRAIADYEMIAPGDRIAVGLSGGKDSLALANYLCDKDRAHLRKLWFYFFTLLSFHTGAAAAFFAVKWWYIRGAMA